jgi:para-nitrobenzyl esterase
VDGDVLPEPPLDRLRAGASADIDLFIGSNTQEARLFQVPGGLIDQVTDDFLTGMAGAYGLPVETALAAYRDLYPGGSAGDIFAAIQGDWLFRIPSLRIAEARAALDRSAPTYMYEFAWPSPQFDGRLGAGHALEIPFVFDTLGHQTEALHGAEPPQTLADAMHGAWVAFAKTGDPGWTAFDLDRRATMRFDTPSKQVEDPLARERALWNGVR